MLNKNYVQYDTTWICRIWYATEGQNMICNRRAGVAKRSDRKRKQGGGAWITFRAPQSHKNYNTLRERSEMSFCLKILPRSRTSEFAINLWQKTSKSQVVANRRCLCVMSLVLWPFCAVMSIHWLVRNPFLVFYTITITITIGSRTKLLPYTNFYVEVLTQFWIKLLHVEVWTKVWIKLLHKEVLTIFSDKTSTLTK